VSFIDQLLEVKICVVGRTVAGESSGRIRHRRDFAHPTASRAVHAQCSRLVPEQRLEMGRSFEPVEHVVSAERQGKPPSDGIDDGIGHVEHRIWILQWTDNEPHSVNLQTHRGGSPLGAFFQRRLRNPRESLP
jgi:hypothetical protein